MDFQKLSKYSFFIFLFLLPFQTVLLLREVFLDGEKWQYGTIGIYLTDVFVMSALVFAVYGWLKKHRGSGIKYLVSGIEYGEIHNTKYKIQDTTLILLVLWSGLSILWAQDVVLAGYFFAKLLLGAGAFFLARSLDESGVKMALKVLLAAAVIQGVIGIAQFVSQETVSSSILGMSAHESWTAGTSVLKSEGGRFLRAYGSLPHPNMLGGFLATILVAGISYLVSGIAYGENTKYQIRNTGYRFIMYHASLILILLALILTFSRAAWLGAALGVGMIAFFQKSQISNHKSKIVFGVIGMATAVFVFVLRDQVFPRFEAATIVGEGSVSERMVSLEDAKTLIAEHSFLGVGAGTFTKAIMENEPARPVWSVQPAHNVFALVWAELGVVGVSLFLLFLFSVIASVVKQSRNQEKSLDCHGGETPPRNDRGVGLVLGNQSIIFAIAFLVLLPSLFLDHWLWSSHFGLLLLFLLAGLAVRDIDNTRFEG